jgi:NAD(P)-dependent dehydrogenase (short-subunit alcohol dehydrogenase family)
VRVETKGLNVSDLDYTNKRVVVTGGATGVGAALLELLAELGGPEVTVLDVKAPSGPHARFLATDLSDAAAVDAALTQIEGPVDALFNNAGVADTLPPATVFRVNVLAPLRLTEGLLPQLQGGAVVNTASIAGMAWTQRLADAQELLSLEGWDARFEWFDGRELGVDTYAFTKEVVQIWTMRAAKALMQQGTRINSVCPSPIDTPLLDDFRKTLSDAAIDFTVNHAGGRLVAPREVASALAWLGSPASSFVSGQNINIDAGFQSSMITGQLDTSSVRKGG